MIPNTLSLASVQEFARDVYNKFDSLLSGNVDFNGRRISNAGKSVADFDYVTRFELDQIAQTMRQMQDTIAEIQAWIAAKDTHV